MIETSQFHTEEEDERNLDSEEEDENDENNRKSSTWNYFKLHSSGKKICKSCSKEYGIKTGISTLKKHLYYKHNITINNIKNIQSTLNFSRVDPWPISEKQARDKVIIDWIISDLQPFQVVENPYFIRIFKKFDPRYQVPNRQNLKNMVVNEFNNIRENISAHIAQIPGKIALTADMWTSKFTNDAFLGLTVHYIDQDWKLQNFLLDIIPFTQRHSGINIASSINSVLIDFNLQEKTLALTTDNESAMLVCGRTLGQQLITQLNSQNFKHYRCAAHILNLAAQQGLELISDEIIKVRELMNKIKHSIVISDQLKNLCSFAKITYLRPELDCKTRWNSTYNMIKKLEKMWRGLQLLAVENSEIQSLLPTDDEWKIIKETLIVLEPLEKATVYLSAARYPTIADVRFVFLGILDHLNDLIELDEFSQRELASSINQKIEDYWEHIDKQTVVATILDPRTKLTLFESGTPTSNAISIITTLSRNYYIIATENYKRADENNYVNTRDYFARKRQRSSESNSSYSRRSSTSSIASSARSEENFLELDRYLALPCDEKVNPLIWWQAHQQEFPKLSLMARDYLCIQATSVACEQLFSVAANTITKTRNRLDPETARATLCAKSWLEKVFVNTDN